MIDNRITEREANAVRGSGRVKALLKRIPAVELLRPGWPDQARVIVQTPVFQELLAGAALRGSCLNAGFGEGLFLPFLNSFSGLTRITHLDLELPNHPGALVSDSRNAFVQGSLTDLPFRDNEFDFVVCTEVIEHIEDDARALAEIARVLRPGGTVLLSTPTPPAPADPAHVREGYTLDQLTKKLSAVGITVTRHQYCFHAFMRALLTIWRWQYERGGRRQSWMPKAVVLTLGYCDRWFRLGKPWDIALVGSKS